MTSKRLCIVTLFCLQATVAMSLRAQAMPNTQNRAAAQVQVDTTQVRPTYSNFSRVTGTPEEVIVDFALNPNPTAVPKQPLAVNNRVVMNYYTAKRLLMALQISVQRHEKLFGPVETDIKKRMINRHVSGSTASVSSPPDQILPAGTIASSPGR